MNALDSLREHFKTALIAPGAARFFEEVFGSDFCYCAERRITDYEMRFVIYYVERGRISQLREFNTQLEAARYLLSILPAGNFRNEETRLSVLSEFGLTGAG